MAKINPAALRQHYRQRRRSLTEQEQQQASCRVRQRCEELPQYQRAQRIALYLANDGELDPTPLIQACWEQGKEVFLPVLHPFCAGYLLFVAYRPDSTMAANRFGIAEPPIHCHTLCPLNQLDLIFAPLVAFDHNGNRMGMGGGFYDRTLKPIHRDHLSTQVLGLAHDCQRADLLPVQPWDIPLHGIVTPGGIFTP
ncbi:5-formyltetrahydrofolate cyclo-ligase [Bowmanella dokdonensis]|uniref:5-formyltetrahydrofolate cyclo-ligase n=1 Tax=Bowmanella dokdonensis TaxID=751969 RepID=A0A939IQZ6_9ALTE|nr:5-formyltetrahydrofolate cyclo-ligase [Bowmanella dokdonensis]MBN7825584.1 5-formyltetrahydrofolate cyclo-ligase [Bowmanella dokdonensis]